MSTLKSIPLDSLVASPPVIARPTAELRIRNGVLEQCWQVGERPGALYADYHEWRPVPVINDEGEPQS